jgi:hypothetical protein
VFATWYNVDEQQPRAARRPDPEPDLHGLQAAVLLDLGGEAR